MVLSGEAFANRNRFLWPLQEVVKMMKLSLLLSQSDTTMTTGLKTAVGGSALFAHEADRVTAAYTCQYLRF